MSEDPYLAKLKEQARAAAPAAPPKPPAELPQPLPEAPAPPNRRRRSYRDRRALAFWQSEVVNDFIRRQISGDDQIAPASHFSEMLGDAHRNGSGVSLRAGDPQLESDLLRNRACRSLTILGGSAESLDYARARVPDDLRSKLLFEQVDPIKFSPPKPLTLVVANSALHRVPNPDALVERVNEWLTPGGMVYVDEFVGPNRFQWTDTQLEIVNQLLACLPDELRIDLAGERDELKNEIARPDLERFSRDHPTEAVASAEIKKALDTHLEPVSVRPYGGAIFHQLFARIMGNFVRRPEVVRLILELDAILTDRGVVESDYLWAAYRKPA